MSEKKPTPGKKGKPKERGSYHYSSRVIIEALRDKAGIISAAAQALGCERSTIYDRIAQDPKVAKAYEDIIETTLDHAEAGLMNFIFGKKAEYIKDDRTGELRLVRHPIKPDLDAVKFYLRTKGKKRGYVERTELASPGGAPLPSGRVIVYVPNNGREKQSNADSSS